MERKILLSAIAVIIILIIAAAFFAMPRALQDEKRCATDSDCACGVHKTTGDCFYGNINFVDVSRQCPDFCNGIAAHLEIKCVANECTQVQKQG